MQRSGPLGPDLPKKHRYLILGWRADRIHQQIWQG